MTQSYKEAEEIRLWLQKQHIPTISDKLRISKGKLYYFADGRSQSPTYEIVRELQLLKQKMSQ